MALTTDDNRLLLKQRYTEMLLRQRKGLEAVCRQFFPGDPYHQHELMQLVAIRLWNILAAHANEDEREWEKWCPRIARETALNYLKSRDYASERNGMPLPQQLQDTLADENADSATEGTELDKMDMLLRRLDTEDYEVVAPILAGKSLLETARTLSISLRSLHYRLRNIRDKLKTMQEEDKT